MTHKCSKWGMNLGYLCVRRYKKNEVFLDVVESVNLLVNSNGTVVRSEVMGALKMRTFLSGMPECKLGLNDKVSGLACIPVFVHLCV